MVNTFTFRTAQGVWVNDMRNAPFLGQDWPCVILDEQSMADIEANIKLQSESGFKALAVFGLLTASGWLPDIVRTVDADRKRKVKKILQVAKNYNIKILYGLGVYSWGFDEIIKSDPAVQGTNTKVMCASKEASLRWMEKVVDYCLDEFGFEGFHLEAADLGRCECSLCKSKTNSEYFCDVNAKTAVYIRSRDPKAELMVSMCGYLAQGQTVPRMEWQSYQQMSEHIDYLIDPGHFGTFIPLADRAEFMKTLKCAFGNGGGAWLYPPQHWDRHHYFIPYTQRAGKYIEALYEVGGRAMEYNVGPAINPAVEVNIAFGGRKLANVNRNNREILLEVVDQLYHPKDAATTETLANVFEESENAFFEGMSKVYPTNGLPLGEIHLTYLFGTEAGPPVYLKDIKVPKEHAWYLVRTMPAMARKTYEKKLRGLLGDAERLRIRIGDRERLERITKCFHNVLADLA